MAKCEEEIRTGALNIVNELTSFWKVDHARMMGPWKGIAPSI